MISVIFDMDGTLLDTQRICIPAWTFAGEKQGFKDLGKNIPIVCGMNQAGWSQYLKDNYPDLDIDMFIKDSRKYIAENLIVKFKKGGEELLKFLNENNIKVGLASGSSTMTIDRYMSALNIDKAKVFDAIVGGETVENGKPEPDIFLQTAKLLETEPEDCIVFEDSPNGVKAAVAAGMRCIGIPDVAEFKPEIKKLLYKELKSLDEAIGILLI